MRERSNETANHTAVVRTSDEQIAEWRELVEYLARGSDPAVRLLKPALDALEAERARADEAEAALMGAEMAQEAISAPGGYVGDPDGLETK